MKYQYPLTKKCPENDEIISEEEQNLIDFYGSQEAVDDALSKQVAETLELLRKKMEEIKTNQKPPT